jgi:ParB family chromosome partitioning protein
MRSRGQNETPASLVQRYEEQARGQRRLVRDLQTAQGMLERLDRSFRCLLADEHFVTLLRAERLDRILSALLKRTQA